MCFPMRGDDANVGHMAFVGDDEVHGDFALYTIGGGLARIQRSLAMNGYRDPPFVEGR